MADAIFNTNKCRIITITRKKKITSSIKFYMAGNELENVNKIKDLGITASSLI